MSSLYDLLGVECDATGSDIAEAFRAKAKETHPDRGGDEEAMKALVAAYTTLRDPLRRAAYDRGEETTEENAHIAMVMQLWAQAVEADADDPFASCHDALIAECRKLAAARREADADIARLTAMRETVQQAADSGKVKLAPFGHALTQLIRRSEKMKATFVGQLKVTEAARDWLDAADGYGLFVQEQTFVSPQLPAWSRARATFRGVR